MKLYLRTALAVVVFMLCAHKDSAAQSGCNSGGTGCAPAPEIDPSFAASEAILLGGVILMIRGRVRR